MLRGHKNHFQPDQKTTEGEWGSYCWYIPTSLWKKSIYQVRLRKPQVSISITCELKMWLNLFICAYFLHQSYNFFLAMVMRFWAGYWEIQVYFRYKCVASWAPGHISQSYTLGFLFTEPKFLTLLKLYFNLSFFQLYMNTCVYKCRTVAWGFLVYLPHHKIVLPNKVSIFNTIYSRRTTNLSSVFHQEKNRIHHQK